MLLIARQIIFVAQFFLKTSPKSRIICPELQIKNKKESNVRLLLEIKFVYLCDKIFRRIIYSGTKDFGVIFIIREIDCLLYKSLAKKEKKSYVWF